MHDIEKMRGGKVFCLGGLVAAASLDLLQRTAALRMLDIHKVFSILPSSHYHPSICNLIPQSQKGHSKVPKTRSIAAPWARIVRYPTVFTQSRLCRVHLSPSGA